jgi:transposase-like protein
MAVVGPAQAGAGRRVSVGEQEGEPSRLRAEVAPLRMEREILKKAAAFFVRESK